MCEQHLENMLRKVYPGRQVECRNSSQHIIDYENQGGKWRQWSDSRGWKHYQKWQENRKWNTGMWL